IVTSATVFDGLVLQLFSLVALTMLLLTTALSGGSVDSLPESHERFVGILVITIVGVIVYRTGRQALLRPEPATVQAAVKTGVFSLVWLDVAAVAAFTGVSPALAVAAWWVPAFLLGKWLYST